MASSDLLNILQEVRGRGVPGQLPSEGYYYQIALNPTYIEHLIPTGQSGMYGAVLSMYTELFGEPADTNSTGLYDELIAIYEDLTVDDHNGNPGVYGDFLIKYNDFLTKYATFQADYTEFAAMFNQIDWTALEMVIASMPIIEEVGNDLLDPNSTIIEISNELRDPTGTLNTIKNGMAENAILDTIYDDMTATYSHILNAKNNADLAFAKAGEAKTYRDSAQQWAEYQEDMEIEPGKYSSKHHAIKAEASAERALVSEGFADTSELNMWAAQAEALTAESQASQPYEEFVRDYYSNGDGTFSYNELGTYSALHYKFAVKDIGGDVTTHIGDFNNPHAVSKAQVGLSVVDNTSDADKPISDVAVIDLATKVEWKGEWAIGTYDQNDQVLDEGYLAIANKQTSERAAPILVGNPVDGMATPAFITQSATAVVYSGTKFTMTKNGWLTSVRIRVPQVDAETHYRIITVDHTDPLNPIIKVVTNPNLVPGEFTIVQLGEKVARVGTIFEVYIEAQAYNTHTDVTGEWTMLPDSNTTEPVIGQVVANLHDTRLRINKFDDAHVDRTADLLTLKVGSSIKFTQNTESDKNVEFTVLGAPTDGGDYIDIDVLHVAHGIAHHPIDYSMTTMDAKVFDLVAVEYDEADNYWTTNPCSFATVEAILYFASGTGTPGLITNAYGADLTLQEATVSPDWDLVASYEPKEPFPEAPVNGNQYARKDGAWSVVTTVSGGTGNLESDGSVLMDSTWDSAAIEAAGDQAIITKKHFDDGMVITGGIAGTFVKRGKALDSAQYYTSDLRFVVTGNIYVGGMEHCARLADGKYFVKYWTRQAQGTPHTEIIRLNPNRTTTTVHVFHDVDGYNRSANQAVVSADGRYWATTVNSSYGQGISCQLYDAVLDQARDFTGRKSQAGCGVDGLNKEFYYMQTSTELRIYDWDSLTLKRTHTVTGEHSQTSMFVEMPDGKGMRSKYSGKVYRTDGTTYTVAKGADPKLIGFGGLKWQGDYANSKMFMYTADRVIEVVQNPADETELIAVGDEYVVDAKNVDSRSAIIVADNVVFQSNWNDPEYVEYDLIPQFSKYSVIAAQNDNHTASNTAEEGALIVAETSEIAAEYSLLVGYSVKTTRPHSGAIGEFNLGETDSLFEAGNGTNLLRSNAFAIKENGQILAPSAVKEEILAARALVTKEYVDAKQNVTNVTIGTEPGEMTFDEFMTYSQGFVGAAFKVTFLAAITHTHTVTDHTTMYQNDYYFYHSGAGDCFIDFVVPEKFSGRGETVRFYGDFSLENIGINITSQLIVPIQFMLGFIQITGTLKNVALGFGFGTDVYLIGTDVLPNDLLITGEPDCAIEAMYGSNLNIMAADLYNTSIEMGLGTLVLSDVRIGGNLTWFDDDVPAILLEYVDLIVRNLVIGYCNYGIVLLNGTTTYNGDEIDFDTVTIPITVEETEETVFNKVSSKGSLYVDNRQIGKPFVEEAPEDHKQYSRIDGTWIVSYDPTEETLPDVIEDSGKTAYTVDLSTGNYFEITLNANSTIDTLNSNKGRTGTIVVKQASVGNTMLFEGTFIPPAGNQPELNDEFNAYNVFKYTCVSDKSTVLEFVADFVEALAGYTLANATDPLVSYDLSPQGPAPFDALLTPDGTKMITIDGNQDRLAEYSLSTPYLVSTATFTGITKTMAEATSMNAIAWTNDGLGMLVAGYTVKSVFEYILTIPYDISTLAYTGRSMAYDSELTIGAQGMTVSLDGSKMYLPDYSNSGELFEYEMTTSGDISTSTYTGRSFLMVGSTRDVYITEDGKRMMMANGNTNLVYEYEFGTPYKVDTLTLKDTFQFQAAASAIESLNFANQGHEFYIITGVDNVVHQYSIS